MNSSWLGRFLLSFICIVIMILLLGSLSYAYFGMYGGLYGLGLYGGLYGNSSYGLGGLGLSGLYGSYGLYGLGGLGSMGLYGSLGLYGMSGLYGGMYGGLYGMLGLYSGMYGGLSGMLGLYGGMYGGLYGMSGLYGLSALGGITAPNGLGGISGMGLLGGLYGTGGMNTLLASLMTSLSTTATTPTPTASASALLPLLPFFIAEQAGTWIGTWSNGLLGGQMTLNLIDDPLLATVVGTAQLLGNPTLGALVEVVGEVLNSQVIASGTSIGVGGMTFELQIIGILVSSSQMTGTYNLINLSSGGTITESGTFDLSLVAPII